MVKQGKYTVQLVNADSKTPFPEHTASNGEVYVEVEPNAEYFIRVHSDSHDKVRMDFRVDNKSLGYNCTMSKQKPARDMGIWEYKNEKSYQHALKFQKANVRQADGNHSAPFWTGKVEVIVLEAIETGYREINDFSNSWNGGDVAYVMGISDPDQKKGVKSQKGETFTAHKSKRRRKMYAKGGLLCTITLRYCSTLGLIHAGILPKPPMWDLHRLANPADDNGQEKPKPKSTVKGEGGDKVEVFDLTEE
jgi:hypothetical protein